MRDGFWGDVSHKQITEMVRMHKAAAEAKRDAARTRRAAKLGAPIAFTTKPHSYPGDTSIQVFVRDPAHPYARNMMFNLWRRRYGRLGLYYFNDRYSHEPFRTIEEAKKYALQLYKRGER